jgi:hypothetical protein
MLSVYYTCQKWKLFQFQLQFITRSSDPKGAVTHILVKTLLYGIPIKSNGRLKNYSKEPIDGFMYIWLYYKSV